MRLTRRMLLTATAGLATLSVGCGPSTQSEPTTPGNLVPPPPDDRPPDDPTPDEPPPEDEILVPGNLMPPPPPPGEEGRQ